MKSDIKNSFIERLNFKIVSLIEELDTQKKPFEGFSPKRPFIKSEKYLYDSFISIGKIEAIFNQLNQSAVFLTNFRNTPKLKKNKINRFDYIIYHLKNHLFRVTGVLDRILLTVNIILNLKLNDKECKPFILLKTLKGKKGRKSSMIESRNSSLYLKLLEIQNFIDIYRIDRNYITHIGRFYDDRLRTIEGLHLALNSSKNLEMMKLKQFIKKMTDDQIIEFKSELMKCNNKLKDYWDSISIELEKEFNSKYQELISN